MHVFAIAFALMLIIGIIANVKSKNYKLLIVDAVFWSLALLFEILSILDINGIAEVITGCAFLISIIPMVWVRIKNNKE